VSGLRVRFKADPAGETEQAAEKGKRRDPGRGPGGDGEASRIARIRAWLRALLRAFLALVATLAVLAAFGGVTDVVLHETRHTTRNSSTFTSIDAVVVVLDGNVSLTIDGRTQGGGGANAGAGAQDATLSAVDTSTIFDDPVRTVDVIGGTLYLTERCPDARCSVQMTLALDTDDSVSVASGNALDLDEAVVEFDGIDGQASVMADPATVVAVHTIVTGAAIGEVRCDTEVDCRDIATAMSS
jgi:hypothetical protein